MKLSKIISLDFSVYNKKNNNNKYKLLVKFLYYIFFKPEFKVIFWVRLASYYKNKCIIYKPLYFISFLFHLHYKDKYGIELPIGLKVGAPFKIAHIPGIIINSNATLGNNVIVMQNVTIGSTRGKGVPTLGNNILLCAGAKVVRGVNIGNNCVIGANAVVVNDVPDNSVVAGVPAKLINSNSNEILKYYM